MSIDHAYQEQELVAPLAETGGTRVHICAGPLLCMGLERILDGTRFVVAGSAVQGSSQPSSQEIPVPDLFIVDEKCCPDSVPELVAELKARNSAARVIVLADHFDISTILLARQAGADGFCLTTSSRDVLIHSIELVMLGEVVVPSEQVLTLIGDNARGIDHQPSLGPECLNGAAPQRPFSERELEVLGWLKEGAPNKVIARRLNVAEATVKVHVKAILRKIGVRNRSQAALWAAYHLPVEAPIQ